jgi:hypothetical protein
MAVFAWQGFEFQHPDDWECVRFSKNRRRGECAFADRRGQRLSVIWSACGAGFLPAKLQAFAAEAAQQLSRTDKAGRIVNETWIGPGPWKGIQWLGAEHLTVAFANFPEPSYVLQVQFHDGRKTDGAEQRRMLESFRFQSVSPWRWSAFGCRLRLPSEFELTGCEVLVGRTTMTFTSPGRRGQRVRIERLALPETQLKGKTLANWRLGAIDDARRVLKSSERQLRGHAAAEFELKPARRTPAQWLTRVRRQARGIAWLCEREGRLYFVEWEGAGGAAANFESMLECCDAQT